METENISTQKPPAGEGVLTRKDFAFGWSEVIESSYVTGKALFSTEHLREAQCFSGFATLHSFHELGTKYPLVSRPFQAGRKLIVRVLHDLNSTLHDLEWFEERYWTYKIRATSNHRSCIVTGFSSWHSIEYEAKLRSQGYHRGEHILCHEAKVPGGKG